MRATLRLSSPAWFAQPRITSSIATGSMPDRSTTAAITVAARSSGRTEASAPPYRPTGVLTAATIQASRRRLSDGRTTQEFYGGSISLPARRSSGGRR